MNNENAIGAGRLVSPQDRQPKLEELSVSLINAIECLDRLSSQIGARNNTILGAIPRGETATQDAKEANGVMDDLIMKGRIIHRVIDQLEQENERQYTLIG